MAEMLSDTEIGRRLRDARKFIRLRQQAVAEQLGVTRQVVSYIETGLRPLRATEPAILCNLYRVTPDEVLRIGNEHDPNCGICPRTETR